MCGCLFGVAVACVVLPGEHAVLGEGAHCCGYLSGGLWRGRAGGAEGLDDEVVLGWSPGASMGLLRITARWSLVLLARFAWRYRSEVIGAFTE